MPVIEVNEAIIGPTQQLLAVLAEHNAEDAELRGEGLEQGCGLRLVPHLSPVGVDGKTDLPVLLV